LPLAPEIVAPSSNPQAYAPPQYVQPENPQPQYAAQPQYAQPTYVQPAYGQTQYAQPQYAQPYGAIPPVKKGLSTGAIVGIVAGSLVLLLVIFGGLIAAGSILSWTTTTNDDYFAAEDVDPTGAAETVEEYLTAIADGDATTARNMIGETASNKFLSEEVLKKSLELAPMTNISVDRDSMQNQGGIVKIAVSFDLGDKTVSRDFNLYNSTDDEWSLTSGLVTVSLAAFQGFTPSFNGVETSDQSVEVFPGTYEVTLNSDAFTVGQDSKPFTFADDYYYMQEDGFEPVLTDEAQKTFTKLVTDSLKECLKMTSLTTPCGKNVDAKLFDGSTVADGDIKRTLTPRGEADLKALQARQDWEIPTKALAPLALGIDIDIELTNGDTTRSSRMVNGILLTPSVDFADENPSVTWE
jgi:hypothetical protein